MLVANLFRAQQPTTNTDFAMVIQNPSFEKMSKNTLNLAADWVAGDINGYTLLVKNEVSTFVYGSNDPVTIPVVPIDGYTALRLGSWFNPQGNLCQFGTIQPVTLSNANAMGPKAINVSAWCNPTQTGLSSTTHFYVALSPIYQSKVADWEVRLFFTFGLPQWEYEEKVLKFTDDERIGVLGFEVSVELDTQENSILYCDEVKLLVAY